MNGEFDPKNSQNSEEESFGFEGESFHQYEEKEERYHPDYAFEALGDLSRPRTQAYSIASLVFGILSLVCCCTGWLGLVLGVLGIVFSVVSRRHLGYFDSMAIAGMTCGIVGAVMGLMLVILSVSGIIEDIVGDIPEDPGYSDLPGSGNNDINNQF